jgi:thiol-disulfide isomerase/thioredoxin
VSRLPRLAHQKRTSPSAAQALPTRRRGTVGLLLVASFAVLTLGAAGCDGGPIAQDTAQSNGQSFVSGTGTSFLKPGARPKAPNVSGTTLSGTHLSLAAYRGSVVVINFWGSWCAPCRAEAPDLAALAAQFRSRGVRFLGIDIQDDPTNAEAFMHTFQISYPSLNDPGDDIALAFRNTVPPAAIPTTLVIDRTGHIAARIVGGATYDALKKLITDVLAEHLTAASGASK